MKLKNKFSFGPPQDCPLRTNCTFAVLNTFYKNDLTHLTENDFKRLIYSYSVKKPFNTIHCK